MGVAAGPNIINDGLLFGYDTGYGLKYFDDNRFYKGKPSTNYIAFQNAVPQSSYSTYVHTTGTWADNHPLAIRAYNAQGNEITGYVNTGVNSGNYTPWQHAHWRYDPILKKPVVVSIATDSQWKAKNFGASMGAWADLGMAAGDKYIISWLQYTTDLNLCADAGFYSKNTSDSNGFHDGRSGSNAKNTKLNTWQRVHHVYTVSSNRNLSNSYGSVYMYTHTTSNNNGEVRIADVQLEIDTEYPSAYIAQPTNATTGSRSITQTLFRLEGPHNPVAVNNVSFDSEGDLTFDGTNDYIITGVLSGRNPSEKPFTVEAIVKANSANGMMWVDIDGNGSNQRFYSSLNTSTRSNFGIQGSAWSSGTPIDTNWHYQAIVMDGSTARAYDNGVQVHTKSYTSYTFPNNLRVGARSGTSYVWDGYIPVFRVYDTALSPEEIKRNYNSYKYRFNI